jgi:hypothetical protein
LRTEQVADTVDAGQVEEHPAQAGVLPTGRPSHSGWVVARTPLLVGHLLALPLTALGSTLTEHKIDDPTSTNVSDNHIAAVVQDVVVIAPGVLKGVGQDRESVKGPFIVDARCKRANVGG